MLYGLTEHAGHDYDDSNLVNLVYGLFLAWLNAKCFSLQVHIILISALGLILLFPFLSWGTWHGKIHMSILY